MYFIQVKIQKKGSTFLQFHIFIFHQPINYINAFLIFSSKYSKLNLTNFLILFIHCLNIFYNTSKYYYFRLFNISELFTLAEIHDFKNCKNVKR